MPPVSIRLFQLIIAALLLVAGPARADADDSDGLTVFAAASLKNAMDDIAAGFEAATGKKVSLSLAGSSALARQIQHGAPADIFISANRDWMDLLDEQGLVDPASRIDLLSNSLVLIAGDGNASSIQIGPEMDLKRRLGDGLLAMALVDAVPAGIYGKAALVSLGQWKAVAGNVVQADNARSALRLVARGEAAMGIVYASDALADPDVRVVGVFPAQTHPPIVYPAASVASSNNPLNGAFLNYLQGAAARAIFERQGFVVLAGKAS